MNTVDWEHQGRSCFFAFKQKRKLCLSDSHRVVLTETVFLSLEVSDEGRYQSLLSSPHFALTTAYLANQKPFQIATLDIFVAMNGVMESM